MSRKLRSVTLKANYTKLKSLKGPKVSVFLECYRKLREPKRCEKFDVSYVMLQKHTLCLHARTKKAAKRTKHQNIARS